MSRRQVKVWVYPHQPPTTLNLPNTLAEYAELWRAIESVRGRGAFEEWKALMRAWSAADWYFRLMFVLSAGRCAWNKYRNEPHFWHESHIAIARCVQFDGSREPLLVVASRGLGKSSHITLNDNIGRKLARCESEGLSWGDPNHTSIIFSATREFAAKHLTAIRDELKNNTLLLEVWDDVFFRNPEEEADTFGVKDGLNVRRPTTRQERSFTSAAFVARLPVGVHPDKKYYDDIEEEVAVSTEDSMALIEERFVSSKDLKSSNPDPDIHLGTYYHPLGLMRKLSTQWKMRTVVFAGEDLSRPLTDRSQAGPLGGTPSHGMTRQDLFDRLNEKGGLSNQKAKRSYGMQIACDPLAGEATRLNKKSLQRFSDDPVDLASFHGMTIVVCADCSGGITDPTAIFVWGLHPSRRYYWLDGERQVLEPSKRKALIYEVCRRWADWSDGNLAQLRIEQFGAAEHVEAQEEYHERMRFSVPIIKCNDNRRSKIDRIFDRWEPPTSVGAVFVPDQMLRKDENGELVDLVSHFTDCEFGLFPKPMTDDLLDAGGLIFETEERAGALPWPKQRFRYGAEEETQHYETGGFAGAGVL